VTAARELSRLPPVTEPFILRGSIENYSSESSYQYGYTLMLLSKRDCSSNLVSVRMSNVLHMGHYFRFLQVPQLPQA